MQSQYLFVVAAAGLGCACVPGGPIYVGPPLATIEGRVFFYESQTPVVHPEVCLFAADTLCVQGDRHGRFKAQLTDRQVDAGTIVVRFRAGGLQPASANLERVAVGERFVVNCAISDRIALSTSPVPCLPTPDDAALPAPPDSSPPDDPPRG